MLGRHWTTATPDQRQRFVNAFYKSLLNNYGSALVDFTADRLKMFPYTGDANAQSPPCAPRCARTTARRCRSTTACTRTDQGWKAWDVVIEGISYVKSFREDFGSEIEQKGLDAVIKRLESGEKPAAIKGNPAAARAMS